MVMLYISFLLREERGGEGEREGKETRAGLQEGSSRSKSEKLADRK